MQFRDLPPAYRSLLEISSAVQFERLREGIEQETARRIALGEQEALASFILQSASFTRAPRVEPALSAREFMEGPRSVPSPVRLRIRDFLSALGRAPADERLHWFARRPPSMDDCIIA